MSLRERVYDNLVKRRNRILEGKINCIPSSFTRFKDDFIGIEQSTYYCISSFTKGGKSQFTSYTFIYKPLLYCYYHKEVGANLKVLYFPLEETPERILQRFECWLLYEYSGHKLRISPRDLRSTTTAVSQEVLDLLQSDEIQDIIKYFEEHVIFPEEKPNPTGILNYCKSYARQHGTEYTNKGKYKDEWGQTKETEVFDHYEQDDPNEYRLIVIDTMNLIDTERGMTLKQSMDKLSEYLAKYLRNRYKFSPVVIQQQAFESEGNDAFKLNRLRPSAQGLGDSKYISRDCNILLGLFSPFRFSLDTYLDYNIKKFKDNIRFLEVCINRDGEMGGIAPLFFDGAVCTFDELPLPNNKVELEKVYKYLDKIRNKQTVNTTISMFVCGIIKRVKDLLE